MRMGEYIEYADEIIELFNKDALIKFIPTRVKLKYVSNIKISKLNVEYGVDGYYESDTIVTYMIILEDEHPNIEDSYYEMKIAHNITAPDWSNDMDGRWKYTELYEFKEIKEEL